MLYNYSAQNRRWRDGAADQRLLRPLGIAKLDAGASSIQLQFVPNPPIDPITIIKLIQNDRTFKLAGQDKLTWQKATGTLKERVGAVKELFKRLKL